jgi:hypothetical protein
MYIQVGYLPSQSYLRLLWPHGWFRSLPMKIYIAYLSLFFVCSSSAFGQNCNCQTELAYVKSKIEKNYAGFSDKVNIKTKASYDYQTALVMEQSKTITKPAYCVALMNEWLKFFKDGHIQIGRDRISADVEKNYLGQRQSNLERLIISPVTLKALMKSKGVTGIYENEDTSVSIAVIENKNSYRDYAGVVVMSRSNNWVAGQIVLELKYNTRNHAFEGIWFDKYAIPNSVSFKQAKNSLGGWQRAGTTRPTAEVLTAVNVSSKILSSSTLYLKVGTFNQANAKNIDSLFRINKAYLEKMPNLILDLRNNGGGADFAYSAISPYLYTDTIHMIGADVLATDDNISGWRTVATTAGIPPDQRTFIQELILKMNNDKGKFISLVEDQKISIDSVRHYPQNIAILINEGCGSTTEEFLLQARQSRKVVLMGEHTAGVLDYANVRGADFSCMPYMLYWATSKSRRISQGLGIDNVGIQPDVLLKPEINWIDAAQTYLERK